MCGIAGIVGPGGSRDLAGRMVDILAHRGPDGRGIHSDGPAHIGQTRLAVIDLLTGDQPMSNEDGGLWVVYNGEIYNFMELREELEAAGHVFRTRSDTEVLLHGWEEWGPDLLPRLNGIFAFALWESAARRLILARDYCGVKPLHYHFDGRTLRFASEIKAILMDPAVARQADLQSLHQFLNLRYVPGEGTLFRDVRRLSAGHYLVFEPLGPTLRRTRYFSFKPLSGPRLTEAEYMEGLRHHLKEAVRRQLVSDVPLGVFLSGGLDSSSLVAFMSDLGVRPIKTFCLGFDEPTDELEDARIVAERFGTDHHEMTLAPDPLHSYPRVVWHAEEPKENVLQGFLLARFARREVKVALGGLGGDELFAGYINNRFIYPSQPLHPLVPPFVSRGLLRPLSRLAFRLQNATGRLAWDEYRRGVQMLLALGDPARYYLILRNVWDFDARTFGNLYGPAWDGFRPEPVETAFRSYFTGRRDALRQVLTAEFHTKMVDDFLMNEDRTSMAHGLEVRVPFLDRDLVRFAFSIPVDLLIKGNRTKHIFFKAMEGRLPARTLSKKKWGFSFNPVHQFRKDLRTVAERVLTRRRVEERGWFNYEYLRRILDHPPHPRLRWHYFFLWLVLGLEIWARMFLEGDPARPAFDLEDYDDRG
ncbi:MAG: asparagine synthase (glutamine-hydrolyzing) [Proteobacteria bacterium]|nr:asparagine synthase (glutamine-hydrolyzing) [Pseudomonadota bacterium]